jgi:hypothetical protein
LRVIVSLPKHSFACYYKLCWTKQISFGENRLALDYITSFTEDIQSDSGICPDRHESSVKIITGSQGTGNQVER